MWIARGTLSALALCWLGLCACGGTTATAGDDAVGDDAADDDAVGDDAADDDAAGDDAAGDDAAGDDAADDDAAGDACETPRPIVFVHGINGSSANFDVIRTRFVDDGYPAALLYFFDAESPSVGCNADNAAAIAALVERALVETGHRRVDLVAHSMGTISSRIFLQTLGGAARVNTFATLGGMHGGLEYLDSFLPDMLAPFIPEGMSCPPPGYEWVPGACIGYELCAGGDLVTALNADPAFPGAMHFVSMYGTADTTVPNASSIRPEAENLAFEGVEHDGPNGLLEREEPYGELRRVLAYPCW
jgi:triacylglycerol lipase